ENMSQSAINQEEFTIMYSGHARHTKPFTLVIPKLEHYLIRIQLEGNAHVWIDDQYTEITPGDMLMLSPGSHYDLKIGYRHPESGIPHKKVHSLDYYFILNGPWVQAWWNQITTHGKVDIGIDDRLLSIWREIMQEQRLYGSHNMNDIVKHLSFAYFRMLERTLNERAHPSYLNRNRSEQIAHQMKHYIEMNVTDPFTLQDVATRVQLSVSRASHIFKETFHQSVMDYAIQLRLTMACERILHGYMPLEQIAEMCGFQSYSYFHRTFKTRLGIAPRDFREQRQLDNHADSNN
ncbi:helix-turn-helix domain-containing protein, partial [Paenibacillus sp. E194]|uniref:helix-turn-helix domain-containing protein n=1 Tax=Paenibacillus sp. E194 TaxID=1458845 RepID=UPI000AA8B536